MNILTQRLLHTISLGELHKAEPFAHAGVIIEHDLGSADEAELPEVLEQLAVRDGPGQVADIQRDGTGCVASHGHDAERG